MVVKVGDIFFSASVVCVSASLAHTTSMHVLMNTCVAIYYITDVQQLRTFSLPFKSIFIISIMD